MVKFGICQTVHSLDLYMPIFLKLNYRQSHPVLSLKCAAASFLGLPLYSVQILWISLHFFVVTSSSASCLYFVAILRFEGSYKVQCHSRLQDSLTV